MIRIGVIGAGTHSSHDHGPALQTYRERHPAAVDLVSVCDLDADACERYAQRFGFRRTYEDFGRMIATESLDALVAVTPVDVTRELVAKLLPHGIPILLEKPPGRTVPEARSLAELATRHATPHAVSMNRRFNPAMVRLRTWLDGHLTEPSPVMGWGRLVRTGRLEAGFVTGTGIHAVDTVRSVLGPPTQLTSMRWRANAPDERRGHYCAAMATCANAVAEFLLLSDAGDRQETYGFVGAGVTGTLDVPASRCAGWLDGECIFEWTIDEDAPRHVRNGTYGETKAFLEAVRGERSFAPTIDDVVPSLATAQAMEDGRSGRILPDE